MSVVELEHVEPEVTTPRLMPWASTGRKIPDTIKSVDSLLDYLDLNWEVEARPYKFWHDGELKNSPKSALVRRDNGHEFTSITGNWEPVQNRDLAEFFFGFVKEGGMRLHAGGKLNDGKTVWLLAEITDPHYLFGGDRIDPNLLFTLPHEYGRSVDIRLTALRFECANALTFALAGKDDLEIKLNHRKKFDPELVRKSLSKAAEVFNRFMVKAEALGSVPVTKEIMVDFIKQVFPSVSTSEDRFEKLSRPAKLALSVLDTQPGAKYAKGTLWQAFNAITYVIDHKLGNTEEARLYASWYGQNRVKKLKALEYADHILKKLEAEP